MSSYFQADKTQITIKIMNHLEYMNCYTQFNMLTGHQSINVFNISDAYHWLTWAIIFYPYSSPPTLLHSERYKTQEQKHWNMIYHPHFISWLSLYLILFRHLISEMNRVRERPWLHRIIDNYSTVSHQIICMHYRKAAFIIDEVIFHHNWKKTNNNQRLLLHARIYNGFSASG